MNKNILYFPTLDLSLMNNLDCEIQYHFFYFENGEKTEVPYFIDNNKFITFGKETDYDKDEHELIIETTIRINKPNILFGKEGIAPSNSKLGLALECYSQKSRFRNVANSNNKYIDEGQKDFSLQFTITIPPRSVSLEVSLSILLFLSKKANVLIEGEAYLNNQEGVILGTLDCKTLYLSGNGSLFPIYIEPSCDKKLWNVEFKYDDPAIDKLSECVKLIINSNHKDFPYLDSKSHTYCERLIVEIVSSTIILLFSDLKENGQLDTLKGNYIEGSILHFFKYCKEVNNIDISDVNTLSTSLREYFEGDD